jgi:carbonic anhydrase
VIQVHGWVYGIHDGLLQDLRISVSGLDDLEAIYKQAVEGVLACSRNA